MSGQEGLELARRQSRSMVWWDIVHTASGLQIHRVVTHFARKRDARRAMDRLLEVEVDWTRASMNEIAPWGSDEQVLVRLALQEIETIRRAPTSSTSTTRN